MAYPFLIFLGWFRRPLTRLLVCHRQSLPRVFVFIGIARRLKIMPEWDEFIFDPLGAAVDPPRRMRRDQVGLCSCLGKRPEDALQETPKPRPERGRRRELSPNASPRVLAKSSDARAAVTCPNYPVAETVDVTRTWPWQRRDL